ncbi:MAG: hypothetical protein ACI9K5_003818 [Gammaproteobacteria bacterium]
MLDGETALAWNSLTIEILMSTMRQIALGVTLAIALTAALVVMRDDGLTENEQAEVPVSQQDGTDSSQSPGIEVASLEPLQAQRTDLSGEGRSSDPSLTSTAEDALGPEVGGSPEYNEANGTAEDWKLEIEGVEWLEIQKQSDKIMLYIKAQASEDLARRRANGEFEVISTDGSVVGLGTGPDRLITGLDEVVFKYGGEVQRYQVPRDQYPELYALADKALWLQTQSIIKKALAQNSH